MTCDQCGRELEVLAYTCSRCNLEYCSTHRLPESHDCFGLKLEKAERNIKRMEGEEIPWFIKSGPDTTKRNRPTETTHSGNNNTYPTQSQIEQGQSVEKQQERKTRRDDLEQERKERYSSPNVNMDGSLSKPNYEEDIQSISQEQTVNDELPRKRSSWTTFLIIVTVVAVFLIVFVF